MAQKIKTVKLNLRKQEKRSAFSKVLPFLVYLSFIWLNLYYLLAMSNPFNFNIFENTTRQSYVFFTFIVEGSLAYLIFEFLFFLYKFALNFSIYSFVVPRQVLNDRFRLWFMIRNIILGLIFNLRFFFSFISLYLVVFETLVNVIIIVCLYFDIKRKHVDEIIAQYVFKALAIPFILYQAYTVIAMVVGVL